MNRLDWMMNIRKTAASLTEGRGCFSVIRTVENPMDYGKELSFKVIQLGCSINRGFLRIQYNNEMYAQGGDVSS